MKTFVMIPLLMFGAAAYDIDLPKPQPVMTQVATPQMGISQKIFKGKSGANSGSDFESKMRSLDKANQMYRVLSSSA